MSKKGSLPNSYVSKSDLKFWVAIVGMTLSLSGFVFSLKGSVDLIRKDIESQGVILAKIDRKIDEQATQINEHNNFIAVVKNILKLK